MEGSTSLLQKMFSVLGENEEKFCIHQKTKSQMVDGEETIYNKKKIANILGIRDEYLRSLLIANGTYLNIPIDGDYFLNIINVIGDGNCGLYSTLVGSYFKGKYREILTGLTKNITQNENYQRLKGKLVERNFRKNLALRDLLVPNLSLRKKYARNTKRDYVALDADELQHIADGIDISIKVLSYAELKQFRFNYNIFDSIYGQINLNRDILILHTPSGSGHYKLILVRRGRFEEGGGAAAAAVGNYPDTKFLREKLKEQIKNKSEFGNMLRSSINSLTNNQLIEKAVEDGLISPNQFVRNVNNTGQPKQEELMNANRTKMKNFFKSKISNSNMKGDLNRSINMLEDEELLRQYLIEKERNKQIKQIIKNYDLKHLLKTFKQKELDEAGGAPARGGTSFVYVSKIGRRKLRYTKTGRKFIINKGKRKYLK